MEPHHAAHGFCVMNHYPSRKEPSLFYKVLEKSIAIEVFSPVREDYLPEKG
jgi:hypothetical protein